MSRLAIIAAALLLGIPAHADTPESIMGAYAAQAHATTPSYSTPSVAAGRSVFRQQPRDWSCATCHTDRPVAAGKHVITGKPIAPLAPSANAARFRDPAKVEKWFKRNCNDTLGRPCTPAEKADVIAYLISTGAGA